MQTVCCSNQKDKAKGISLHVIPFFEDEQPEAKRRRKKWVNFVRQKRAKWQPSKHSVTCSVHFKPEDFERRFDLLQPGGKAAPRWLRKDEFGCCVFATTVGEQSKARETHGKSSLYKLSHVSSFLSFDCQDLCVILGDPGAVCGGGKKSKRARKKIG